jgi:hypothetical protein
MRLSKWSKLEGETARREKTSYRGDDLKQEVEEFLAEIGVKSLADQSCNGDQWVMLGHGVRSFQVFVCQNSY